MTLFSSPYLDADLQRYPARKNDTLRAWDAADELIISYLFENKTCFKRSEVLIVNDNFGALAVNLASQIDEGSHQLNIASDSFLSRQGILQNMRTNSLDFNRISLYSTVQLWEEVSMPKLDLVLIKIPKSLAELEFQLNCLRKFIHADTQIIAGGMTKTIHNSTLKLFERYIGQTKTSLAKKKARLIFAIVDEANTVIPDLNWNLTSYSLPAGLIDGIQPKITSYPGVFSHDKLDMGTRLLLENLHVDAIKAERILDLGCGAGVIGIVASLVNSTARVSFVDESLLAIKSAQANARHLLTDRLDKLQFAATDCTDGIEDDSQDLVLNNPPFHERGGRTHQVSRSMFVGAKRVLRSGGSLLIVSNRHLGYHKVLETIFDNCQLIASNAKFVVLRSINR